MPWPKGGTSCRKRRFDADVMYALQQRGYLAADIAVEAGIKAVSILSMCCAYQHAKPVATESTVADLAQRVEEVVARLTARGVQPSVAKAVRRCVYAVGDHIGEIDVLECLTLGGNVSRYRCRRACGHEILLTATQISVYKVQAPHCKACGYGTHVTIDGVSKTLKTWLRENNPYHLSEVSIRDRLQRGWDPKEAFSTPRQTDGALTVRLAELGLSRQGLSYRLQSGWPVQEALTRPPALGLRPPEIPRRVRGPTMAKTLPKGDYVVMNLRLPVGLYQALRVCALKDFRDVSNMALKFLVDGTGWLPEKVSADVGERRTARDLEGSASVTSTEIEAVVSVPVSEVQPEMALVGPEKP